MLIPLGGVAFFALFSPAHAAISDGQAAEDVLGQYDETSMTNPQPMYTKSAANNVPSRLGLNFTPNMSHGVFDTTGHRLFVSDVNNNRILVYSLDTDNTMLDRIPDYVLGQSSFATRSSATTQSGLNGPRGLVYDTSRNYLFVADLSNHRVIVYDVASITNGENAINVLGQSSFTAGTAATTQAGMNGPAGLAYDQTNSRLFVSQYNARRITTYDVTSITDGEDATNVLGQSTFTDGTAATSTGGLRDVIGIDLDPATKYLYVGDSGNRRVIIYDVESISNGENAINVLGQPHFTTNTSSTTQARLKSAVSVTVDSANSRIFVADFSSNRVMVFNVSTITNGMSGSNVLGQTTFTGSTAGTTQSTMSQPYTLAFNANNNRFYAADTANNRITVYDTASITNGENAVDALGQYDDSPSAPGPIYTKAQANNVPNLYGINIASAAAAGVTVDTTNHRLFVTDTNNHRVLVYNLSSSDVLSDRIPDYVLGQSTFYTNTSANSQSAMQSPQNLAYDGTNNRLFVSSAASNRVLVFDVSSITNGENAAYVLGQPDFTTISTGTTQAKMSAPYGMAYDAINGRLFVADSGNSRVLVYDLATISDGENAANVLGQSSFITSTAATTQAGMSSPSHVTYDATGDRLFVADGGNHRVTTFDVANISNGENASNVLGQANFTTATAATTQTGASTPRGITYDNTNSRLFVADAGNHRILVYSVASITDGEAATNVLGQSSFTAASTATTQTGLSAPRGISYVSTTKYLFVADSSNNRIIAYDFSDVASSSAASSSSSSAAVVSGGGRRGGPGRGGEAPVSIGRRVMDVLSSQSSSQNTPHKESLQMEAIARFSDVPSSAWFFQAVERLANRAIVSGYADIDGTPINRFNPGDPVTVGQILKIALLAGGHRLPIPTGLPRNPTATDWSAPYVAVAETIPLTLAMTDVLRPATRSEVILTLLEAFSIPLNHNSGEFLFFTDLPIDHPHRNAILTAAHLGIITGDTDAAGHPTGAVRADDPINRAETAVLAQRLLEL